jgi:hypothetical protein
VNLYFRAGRKVKKREERGKGAFEYVFCGARVGILAGKRCQRTFLLVKSGAGVAENGSFPADDT